MESVIWESWACPRCRRLYEQDNFEFMRRPPMCRHCFNVFCVHSLWWNDPPKPKPKKITPHPADDGAETKAR